MTTIINGPDDLKARVGQHLGYSDWLEITQERVNQFADATGDHQWIHVDVERAKEGPFGGPIAHGFLTLSLAPGLLKDVWAVQGAKLGVNYGLNKVRFIAPVPVDSRLRAHLVLLAYAPFDAGALLTVRVTIEREGSDKPVCVAESLSRRYI